MIERVSVYMYTFSNCYNDVDYEIVDDIFGQSQVSIAPEESTFSLNCINQEKCAYF